MDKQTVLKLINQLITVPSFVCPVDEFKLGRLAARLGIVPPKKAPVRVYAGYQMEMRR